MTMTKHPPATLLILAAGVSMTACAKPCYDDGLLQSDGDAAACAALASAGGTEGGTNGSVTMTDTTADTADGGQGTCDNGVRDGDETDVDCGGSCAANCGNGEGCGDNDDCQSASCDQDTMTCGGGGGGETCQDGVQNQDETDADCGGVCGPTCEIGEGCTVDEDCVSDFCDPDGTCQPNTQWCADADGDGFGDPEDCTTVDDGEVPPDGFVNNDDDCDDASPFAFPGAAPNDSRTACMEDKDGDDWGDDTPSGDNTVPGTDCDDEDAALSGDGCMRVDVTATPINILLGESSDLLATAMGGDGNYSFAWSPAGSLDDATIADPVSTPATSTTYDVTVTDGNATQASGEVTVHVTDAPVPLDGCEEVALGIDLANNPLPNWDYTNGGTQACETNNGDPTALVCNVKLHDAMFTAQFGVLENSDNDHIGFVWGYQDSQHFYVLTWKQEGQTFTDCGIDVPTGVVIKVIDAAGALQCEDLLGDTDTPNSTVLALPDAFYDQGWADNEEYRFELEHTPTGFTVRIILESNGNVLAEQTFADTTYPSGRFGVYTYSQSSSCFWDVFTTGL